MLDQHLDDGGHGKQVRDAMLLDQLPEQFWIELFARQQDGRRPAGDVKQRVNSRAVRERCDDDRPVCFVGARDQVGQVIVDDKIHLVMRQNPGLGLSGRARGVEEPERVAGLDGFRLCGRTGMTGDQILVTVLALARRPDRDHVAQIAGFSANRVGVLGEQVFDHHGYGVA